MIVFSTCWYILKTNFNKNKNQIWIDNFLNNVKSFKLIIYTNEESYYMIEKFNNNQNIKIIKLELWEFYNFKYRDFWINNHINNLDINNLVDSRANMIWNEKIFLVKRSYENKYFLGKWYGWIDIEYFKFTEWKNKLYNNWPNYEKVKKLNKEKIYYIKINNNKLFMNNLHILVSDKNELGLPKHEIPNNQRSIATGFFLIYYEKINWYSNLYNNKIKLYLENNRLINNDKIIVIDNIFSNFKNFILI